MTLPPDFQFSQASLQDYEDCPRRFQLRYVDRLRWPALEEEPALENERYLRRGAAFHRLLQQHLSGIPAKRLWPTVPQPLRQWWRHYLESGPADLPRTQYPEVALSASLGAYRLVAQYDLVAVDVGERVPGTGIIVDWKTNHRRPSRQWLTERWQTRVYPYLLVRAGAELNEGKPFQPARVEMIYWFANAPARPERFVYSAAQYDQDEGRLIAQMEEIARRIEESSGDLVKDERYCQYCRYRSLCGSSADADSPDEAKGDWTEAEDFGFEFDFEQIAEVEY